MIKFKKHKNCIRCIWYEDTKGSYCSMGFPTEKTTLKTATTVIGDPNNEMYSDIRPKYVCPKPYNASKLSELLRQFDNDLGRIQREYIIPQQEK